MNEALWEKLTAEHPRPLVESLRQRFERGESFAIYAEQLVADTSLPSDKGGALLEALVQQGLLEKSIAHVCACGAPLAADEAQADTCPHCGQAFVDIGGPEAHALYVREGVRRRDVRWVLVLHGMNTRGPWQEELSWLVSRTYGHSVPVAIYKYGVIRPGAVLRFRLRALTSQLNARIKRLCGEGEKSGFGGIPDVLAHSLGTWLLGHALQSDRELRVGRVVLTGCILRPDFDWAGLIDRGQVEAVLCHYGSKDFWARVAHFVIPDSGPSGRRGFNDTNRVTHVETSGLSHSGFFLEEQLPSFHHGIWQPFLTTPKPTGIQNGNVPARPWRSAGFLRTHLLRWIILFVGGAFAVFVVLSFGLGAVSFFRHAFMGSP